ncbi:MAG: Dyp-type peroxidase [Cyanobacteria bacterium P01_C01_bin.72]
MTLNEAELKNLPPTGIDPENPGKYQTLLSDLQGNILKGHGREHSVHLFVQWKPEQIPQAKEWIRAFTQTYVTSAQKQSDEAINYKQNGICGGFFANFYLTRFGYEALGYDPFQVPKNQPFTMGMKNPQIREFLGDPEVENWETGFKQEIHALILIADDNINELLQLVNQVTAKLRPVAHILHREDGFVIRNAAGQAIEHFGFVDGVSQPLFLQRDIAKATSGGFDKWDPRASLDLVLVKDPNGKTEDSYGSYLVYRKLEQNVKAFRADQEQLAQQLKIDDELAGAMVMGRFPDGTPLTESDKPNSPTTPPLNFNYDEDVSGSKCPFHAHVRKTNPRGDTGRVESSPGFDEALEVEKSHQIVRRAISYGESNTANEPERGSGLLFLCFQANIENQFNFMQARWANADRFVKVGVGPDPVIGQPEGVQRYPKVWGESETEDYGFKLWVFMQGGEYFFAPSISFLSEM